MFDPYRKWLGIPPKDQPPNHYRLLGLETFESDLDIIEGGVERQMSFVRQYQSGEHAAEASKLLNELAIARLCLLKPDKKAAYDAQLRRKLAPPKSDAMNLTEPQFSTAEFQMDSDLPPSPKTRQKKKSGQPGGPPQHLLIAGGIGATVVLLLVAFLLNRPAGPRIGSPAATGSSASTNSLENLARIDGPKTPIETPTSDNQHSSIGTKSASVRTPTTETRIQPAANPIGGFALHFEEGDFVELTGSLHAVDLSLPFTVELWLRFPETEKESVLFGDYCWGKTHPDDPERAAAGWALQVRNNQGEYKVGVQYALAGGSATHSLAPMPTPGDAWHHLALCSTSETARVYVDGKLSSAHPALAGRIRQGYSSLFFGGMEYTTKELCFAGDIRAFRLSKIDRYKTDFTPSPMFDKDDETFVLYDFSNPQAGELKDLASNHAGRISGARWIPLQQAN